MTPFLNVADSSGVPFSLKNGFLLLDLTDSPTDGLPALYRLIGTGRSKPLNMN